MPSSTTQNALPAIFDASLYGSRYADLSTFTEKQLQQHYQDYGKSEGRAGSSLSCRKDFIDLVPAHAKALEIGPFIGPSLRRPRHDVKYFDVMGREQMLHRAKSLMALGEPHTSHYGALLDGAVDIDFTHPTGDLASIGETFDVVLSSHCIEHQTDFIKHMNDVANLLAEGGKYFMVIPDKRYCFDHFQPLSRAIDIIAASIEKRTLHTAAKVLEHRLYATHNDPARHWVGDHGLGNLAAGLYDEPGAYEAVIDQAKSASRLYIDVHNWIFTPDSFSEIANDLFDRGFLEMRLVRVYPTLRNTMEFFAVFERDT